MNEQNDLEKWRFRKEGLNNRRQLDTEVRNLFSEEIINNLTAMPEYQNAKCVFCFASMADEVQTFDLLKTTIEMGKTICIPLIRQRGKMDAVAFSSLDDLEVGKYGILTVKEECRRIIDPFLIDCAIIPGSAFGRDGSRVGLGGGFYDRFLLKTPAAKRIAVCFDCQVFDKVPVEEHDLFMDFVVTDKEIITLLDEGD